jgi:hypothetical protein
MALEWLAAALVKAPHHGDGGDSATRSRRGASALLRAALVGFVLADLGITVPVATGATASAAGAAVPVATDPPFTISGSVNGLAPGVGSQFPLTVSNPYDFPIKVTTLTATVGDAGASCLGQSVQVQPLRHPVQVPARGSAIALLAVTLSNSSPNVCQKATWPVTYGGQAVMVSSPAGGGADSSASSGGSAGGTPIGDPPGTSNGPSIAGLAFTGLTLWILIAAAAALILSGAAVLLAQHRRRRLAAQSAVADESWAR